MTNTGHGWEQPMEQRAVLTCVLTAQDHGRFVEVPFSVPQGTERISVSCEVEGYEFAGKVVDLGLRDPVRARGWSGGARSEFWVEGEKATPGYLPGHIQPGEWAVIVSSNRLPQAGCRVTLIIECIAERYRWLKGDLHLHSVHSDGVYELDEVLRLSQAAGLDFIALTDHNTTSQNLAHPRENSILCIPGMELTTYRGHANLLGLRQPLGDFRVNTRRNLDDRLSDARQQGARIVMNHPFKECDTPGCRWEWGSDVAYDWVEVWNGPWRECNSQAVDWWQAQLAGGRRLVAVGGSDTHRPHPLLHHGMPTNWVWSRSRSTGAILEAVSEGHVFLNHGAEGPTIDLSCGPYIMGDEVGVPQPEEIRLIVDAAHDGDLVKLFSDRGLEDEVPVTSVGPNETVSITRPVDDRRFYRVEVWRYSPQVEQPLMAALSNPIYFRP